MTEQTNTSSIKSFGKVAAVAAAGTPALAQATSIGPLALSVSPWFLVAGPAVGILWWLMKSIPKTPIQRIFPGITLLYNLKAKEQTATRMPWWQYIPITLATASVVGIFAKPELNPQTPLAGNGPVPIVADNDYAAARNWKARTDEMNNLVNRAERAGRTIVILPTAAPADGSPVRAHGPMSPGEARAFIKDMKPQPWPSDRAAAVEALSALDISEKTTAVWLSNGLHDSGAGSLVEKLQSFGNLIVVEDEKSMAPRLIDEAFTNTDGLTVKLRRTATEAEETLDLIATDETGQDLNQISVTFKAGENQATGIFNKMTNDIANKVVSINIKGDATAGARLLVDENSRRRPVGIIRSGSENTLHPLATESHYIAEALRPSAIIHQGSVDELLKFPLSVMVMVDSATVGSTQSKKIENWVRAGGTLWRFAGPQLAAQKPNTDDPLLSLRIRPDARSSGGDLSGSQDGKLAEFPASSPFAKLTIPDNAYVKTYVVPEAGQAHDGNTWASLQNKMPLVTAKKHGAGQIILMHTTADTAWTDIPLSGLYLDMARAIVKTSQGVAGRLENGDLSLPPVKIMDGYGRLGLPEAGSVRPLTAEAVNTNDVSPRHPPGFYGDDNMKQAHNLSGAVAELKPLADMPESALRRTYESGKKDTDITGYMWAGAFLFLMLHLAIMTRQRQGVRTTPKPGSTKAPTLTPDT